jgi:small subunit ribosomal protein S16|uniref:Small ribosomal subunit protein bS16 n=1 Tax=Desulfomonile tiedjei TaxID=2358 RepID=A0A7C4EWA4_9BACT
MAVKIRLARFGAKKKPFYRIVAADSEAKRDGRFLEVIGTYDPRDKIAGLKLDATKMQAWAKKGAQLTPTAAKLFRQSLKEQSPSE